MQSTTITTRGPTGAGALMTALAVVAGILTVVRIDVLALPFAFLATGLVVSGVYLVLNLRGLTCAIELPTEIRVGEAMAFDLRLDVSWPLLVPQDVQVRVAFDGRSARPLAVVARFERGTSLALRGSHRFGLRGPREVANVTLVSSAPFRWFELTRAFVLPVRLLVLPAFDRLRNADAMRLGAYDAARRKRKPRAEEHLAAVRPWRPGESERLIHWKLTAKRGVRVAREFEASARAAMHLVLLTRVDGVRVRTHWAFERAVRLAASLVEHFHAQGHPVRFTIVGERASTLVAARHRHGTRAIQRELATLAPRFGDPAEVPIPLDASCVVHAGARVALAPGIVELDVMRPSTMARWIGFAGRTWRGHA